ncbi:redox-sensing transcriptional repressor Rex [Tetragenococcus halophilus]|uniref:redox-sensing transcriptional repressor Rex n=1 Tax=Tetragenococcus halophilus TaxID=51669 RepID=UPI001F3E1E10|nr:redox-sensing transcriptional repressor Rex [Tetragenococcus halophilus]MCF1602583.1 redox-sensing transcriptional repressor Rex [Tetragenococcus halophilus]MCF1676186.1 redox-sensing transcriptional repressor Rex [Tetragenococcus halophilus]MDN5831767.1 redox-sensing transcriptional repressor Rex [Tetragenococcus halophilus]MDN6129852.1 redox-sensing transcriptional repressor Rex [Tetragenococcus halophilus]MDN6568831.1 redox-sensing transcriptional repressor Rex [Tetragenococcus halophilu
MKENNIPKATAKRLPLYYRYLRILNDAGKAKVSSTELSEAVQVDSATIRRDFSYFGELGKRGYGYDVESLMQFFSKTLSDDEMTNVALVGVGNLGSALLKYKFHQSNSIRVSAAFDVNSDIVGRIVDGIPVYPMSDMEEQIEIQRIEIAILTVPASTAQDVVNNLVESGIKGILNFTPVRISAPSDVLIQNVDLTNELQTLIYFLHSDDRLNVSTEEKE